MENQNINLQSQIQKNVKERKEIDDKTTELLDILDEVGIAFFSFLSLSRLLMYARIQVYEKWSKLPLDEIEMWTVQTVEAAGPPRPP
jgi:kinetochore protein NNF1